MLSLIRSNDQMVVVDLKKAFHHTPIQAECRDFFGFQFKGQAYRWKALPFGWSCSPYYHGKILRPVISYLRSRGLWLVCYSDDILLLAQPEDIKAHSDLLLSTLRSLGWTTNLEKSCLVPRYSQNYIGYRLDSHGPDGYPVIRIPPARVHQLHKDIKRVLKQGCMTATVLARICGQCVSMAKAVLPGKLLLRNAYRLLRQRVSWGVYYSWTMPPNRI